MKDNHRLILSYDGAADVLYICKGPVRATHNTEEEAGLVMRYDPASRNAVGATIIDYKEHWLPQRRRLAARLADAFGIPTSEADKALQSAVKG